MDLEGIRLLLRVVDLGSVQRAAQLIGMSRSSLRRKLENLEAEVGVELFVRSATGVVLTPAGAVVLEDGRALLERFARMVGSAKSAKADPAGIVRVVVPVGLPDSTSVEIMRVISAIAPNVCVEETERAEPLDHLHEPFDLLFHFGEPPPRGEWFSRVLGRVRLMPLASKAYLAEKGKPSSPSDLIHHRILGWQVGRSNPREWPLTAGGVLVVHPIVCSRNGQLVHRAAQEGIGILLGDPDSSRLSIPTPLIPVLESDIGGELVFRCLSPTPSDTDPRTRAVLESIQTMLGRMAAGVGG
jgi:DNA-binding transcriptional LysR family regulator